MSLQVGGIYTHYPVLVVRNVTQECLLGANSLKIFACTINLRERTLSTGDRSMSRMLIKYLCHVSCAETTVVPGCHQMELPVHLCRTRTIGEFEGILEPDTQGATPIRQPPRRLPFHQRDLVKKLLDDVLEQKIVEPACGPWASPIVLVMKKGGTPRFCVDYRRINSLTKKDAHPHPHIDDALDALSGSKWFSIIDLASGYWKVKMEPTNHEKTAFVTPFSLNQFRVKPFGLCVTPFSLNQFRVKPFGLCNASSTFHRLIKLVLAGLHWPSVFGRHHHLQS